MGLCLWSPAAVFQDEIVNNHTLQGKPIDTVAEKGYFDFNSMKLGPQFFEDVKTVDIYPTAKQYLGRLRSSMVPTTRLPQ